MLWWFCFVFTVQFYLFVASKRDGIHIQISVFLKGGLTIAYIYYLVNYMLISSLHLATFFSFLNLNSFFNLNFFNLNFIFHDKGLIDQEYKSGFKFMRD